MKVRSLNDYIFDIKEPLIHFSYLNECVRLNLMPEYLIIDNPELVESNINQSNAVSNNNNINGSKNESTLNSISNTT